MTELLKAVIELVKKNVPLAILIPAACVAGLLYIFHLNLSLQREKEENKKLRNETGNPNQKDLPPSNSDQRYLLSQVRRLEYELGREIREKVVVTKIFADNYRRLTAQIRTYQNSLVPPKSNKPPRVLVVDDEKAIVLTLQTILAVNGFDARGASDGDEALRAILNDEVDVVISDVVMPRLDGVNMLLSARLARPDVPIILFSGKGQTATTLVEEHKDSLGDIPTVHAKPWNIEDLLRTLREAIDLQKEAAAAK